MCPTNDSGRLRKAIEERVEVPEFVKQASAEAVDYDSLPTEAFADRADRVLPVNTKAATWLSHAYYVSQKADSSILRDKAISSNLKAAAAFWGITAECEKVAEELTKPAFNTTAEQFILCFCFGFLISLFLRLLV